jgi:hypothetical protein
MPHEQELGAPVTTPVGTLRFGFGEAAWNSLTDDERDAFTHYGAWVIPHTGTIVSEIVTMVSRNTSLNVGKASIFIAWLEGARTKWRDERNASPSPGLRTSPPFQMSDDLWLWINSQREERGQTWIDADQWELIGEDSRACLAVGLLPPNPRPTSRPTPKVEHWGDSDDFDDFDDGEGYEGSDEIIDPSPWNADLAT